MGDLADFAIQICDSIGKNTGRIAAVCDRDSVIALAGAPKRDLMDRHISQTLEQLLEQRKHYRYTASEAKIKVVDSTDHYFVGVAVPILSQGDLMGGVVLIMGETEDSFGESELKLAQTVAEFLGKQMEN